MRKKTNKKRGDRYNGRGHAPHKAGSRGGVGRAGYKKHKKTSKILQSRIKIRGKYTKYVRADTLIKDGKLKIGQLKGDVLHITTNRKILLSEEL